METGGHQGRGRVERPAARLQRRWSDRGWRAGTGAVPTDRQRPAWPPPELYRFGDTDEEGGSAHAYQHLTQAQLIEACGPTARYLKPYQMVGVNFLMLLYRQAIGGAILADEMVSSGRPGCSSRARAAQRACPGPAAPARPPSRSAQGLGKTAQLITYLGAIRRFESDPGPHLIVVPASLLENWQRELHRWCPDLRFVAYYGKHRGVVRKRLMELR